MLSPEFVEKIMVAATAHIAELQNPPAHVATPGICHPCNVIREQIGAQNLSADETAKLRLKVSELQVLFPEREIKSRWDKSLQ